MGFHNPLDQKSVLRILQFAENKYEVTVSEHAMKNPHGA